MLLGDGVIRVMNTVITSLLESSSRNCCASSQQDPGLHRQVCNRSVNISVDSLTSFVGSLMGVNMLNQMQGIAEEFEENSLLSRNHDHGYHSDKTCILVLAKVQT